LINALNILNVSKVGYNRDMMLRETLEKKEGVYVLKKSINIGISGFKTLIEGNYYFVDKSLLIKEFLENGAGVILIPRPRRSGKTLNLSMLRYFFDIRFKEETKGLFKGLKIEKEEDIMELQGQFPTIFLTFKNEKYTTYEDFVDGITLLMCNLYKEHDYLLQSDKLSFYDKEDYKSMLARKVSIAHLSNGISILMEYMHKHFGKKVMLFIDEYDVPIQEGYLCGYYDQMIVLIRNLLTSALKDNSNLEKSLITGILRVAKESIFSGLNNLEVSTLLKHSFKDKYGFTVEEVEEISNYYEAYEELEAIKQWYNGYIFGGEVIYNPWSVLNYLKNRRDGLLPYWINSSSNDLIKRILVKGDREVKLDLEKLIEGQSIIKNIDDNIVMSEIEASNENIWSFLLMSGYLKPVNSELVEGILRCEIIIPNKEVLIFYKNIIKNWFRDTMTSPKYELMLNMLIAGEIEIFSGLFKEFVIDNLSYFDVSGNEPERVYHAFVLGMLISLSDNYEVKSNKESGYGRYDVMLIPKDISKIGIVMEFKKIHDFVKTTIEEGTKLALKQIEDMKYSNELTVRGVNKIIKLAIVFKGKVINVEAVV
jgi:hypothetical protein